MAKYDELLAEFERQQAELAQLSESRQDILTKVQAQEKQLAELVESEKRAKEQTEMLTKQLEQAKKERNSDFVTWWMNEFPEFDSLTFEEMKMWMVYAAKRYKPSDVGGGGHGKVKTYDVQDSEEIQLKKVGEDEETLRQRKKQEQRRLVQIRSDSAKRGSKLTLADRQRIAIERDHADPIDTDNEVENLREFEEPLGNRNVQAEAKAYLKKKQKITSESPTFELNM